MGLGWIAIDSKKPEGPRESMESTGNLMKTTKFAYPGVEKLICPETSLLALFPCAYMWLASVPLVVVCALRAELVRGPMRGCSYLG